MTRKYSYKTIIDWAKQNQYEIVQPSEEIIQVYLPVKYNEVYHENYRAYFSFQQVSYLADKDLCTFKLDNEVHCENVYSPAYNGRWDIYQLQYDWETDLQPLGERVIKNLTQRNKLRVKAQKILKMNQRKASIENEDLDNKIKNIAYEMGWYFTQDSSRTESWHLSSRIEIDKLKKNYKIVYWLPKIFKATYMRVNTYEEIEKVLDFVHWSWKNEKLYTFN